MRILIADTFPDHAVAALRRDGHEVSYQPDTTADALPDTVRGQDALVVRSTKVTAEAIAQSDLSVVIRAGSGTNTIDCDAAIEHGVAVCNVPGRNAVAVAELTFALLLALDRNIPDAVTDLRAGRWDKKRYATARGILGRRIGVVGLGQIGLAFAERATAFGAHVYAVAKSNRPRHQTDRARAAGVNFVDSIETLAETCDVLSFHVPATSDTRHLVGRDLLARVQPGSFVLNTSRSDVIDEDALIEAMDTKGIRAGLDVFDDEPGQSTGTIDSALARHPNVYGTHHIGASTEQAQHAIADEVVHMIQEFERGRLPHRVTPEPLAYAGPS
ncbi:NAD(P)-dependent oxidoreductase [Haloechinothrix salitolerans]|uniref:NAD(P)-dependent oxidoreductase n=1 Tax=Haloechinothrix salitolerans TaxID=926830 RepID=A0ABW2C364_9PSEU